MLRGSARRATVPKSRQESTQMILQSPPGRKTVLWTLPAIFLALGLASSAARAQVSAFESAARLKPAPGLEATLWAVEPMLRNPTNIDIDSRGRVWVAEGLNYRLTRSGNAQFQRVDDSDMIKILEDTDGDGKADKVTVFADKIFPVPMGLAVEEHWNKDGKYTGCRVFVGNSPDILVLEDTDGDDKADKRTPLLSGFGGVDSDHGVHGMVLGLDGKLYFTQGDGCCSVQKDKSERSQNFDVLDKSGRRVSSDQLANTLQANRDGTQFEVICDRQRNNYETCLNSFGNIFTSDNDDDGNRGCRVIWAMDGGHYGYRTPGSPRHWGEDVPGNIPKLVGTGNGSPAGIMVYEGELLPKEYFGSVLEADAGTRQINFFPITRKGGSFRTEYKIFLASDDPWFRPIDVCAAPDGSVYVADWYDAGVGGHAFSDQTTGRIFRMAPKGHKSQKVKVDFGTLEGLIAALKSPNVATQDTARRLLFEHGENSDASGAVRDLVWQKSANPVYRARALWVLDALKGNSATLTVLQEAHGGDPQIREQALRILGRDCRENGKVLYTYPESTHSTSRLLDFDKLLSEAAGTKSGHLLLKLADDPDAGVRRELVLALRSLPTDKVGDTLRKLAAAWDGQDRWYLEALGLALENRESDYLTSLLDGTLFGPIDLEKEGKEGDVALPPYFPVDRNEAFIPSGAPDQRATALSKNLGLCWRLHRGESLEFLAKSLPALTAPELQDAGDDILAQIKDPRAARITAGLALQARTLSRKQELLSLLARNLGGDWNGERNHQRVELAIRQALDSPELRILGVGLATATRDARYGGILKLFAQDDAMVPAVRVAAIEAIGTLRVPKAQTFVDRLVGDAKDKPSSNPMAEAAVRTLPKLYDASRRLSALIGAREYPLGVRREAIRTLTQLDGGARRILDMATAKTLPDDLRTEATTLLHTSFTLDRRLRDEAAVVLPLPKTVTGQPLPPLRELLRRDGDADKGRAVFFRTGLNACASCHRVGGRGQWVGPDLSTIGTKYGKDELLRSILNPSASIGYSFRSLVLGLADGRVVTGLPVEETPGRLVVKTADGQRVAVQAGEIEDRRTSDVSLMPEGLAQTLGPEELVDLLAYLSSLREPVSIVGQYHVLGPISEPAGERAVDVGGRIDLSAHLRRPSGEQLAWRRLDANAEGVADLTALAGGSPQSAIYAYVTVNSPIDQPARLVVETQSAFSVWLGGKPVISLDPAPAASEHRETSVSLSKGLSTLLLRLSGETRFAGQSTLATTFVSAQPVSFTGNDASRSVR
jgi:putative membrane-bound dehydrogenase-like protein